MTDIAKNRVKTSIAEECRACLAKIQDASSCVDLFGAWDPPWTGMGVSIAEDLAKLANVQISVYDLCSKNICKNCCARLQDAIIFIWSVQHSDKVLRQRHKDNINEAPSWPKPIQVDKSMASNAMNDMNIEIKQEMVTEDECDMNETCSEPIEPRLDIKIEPEEITPAPPIEIEVNGPCGLPNPAEATTKVNGGAEYLDEYVLPDVKEEPVSDDEMVPELPKDCMLCMTSFNSVKELKVPPEEKPCTCKREMGVKILTKTHSCDGSIEIKRGRPKEHDRAIKDYNPPQQAAKDRSNEASTEPLRTRVPLKKHDQSSAGSDQISDKISDFKEVKNKWKDTVAIIPDFNFDESTHGIRIHIDENTTVQDLFHHMFTPDVISYLVACSNACAHSLSTKDRPHAKNPNQVIREINAEEMIKFLSLSLLQGQIKVPDSKKLFTIRDPLYYHPIFNYVMSSHRYEQILRCLCVSEQDAVGIDKMNTFTDMLSRNFQKAYSPGRELAMPGSLLIFKTGLDFSTYMSTKQSKYGLKVCVLTNADGYVLNMKTYYGNQDVSDQDNQQRQVLELMRPYIQKGHDLFVDGFYNSVQLSEKLLELRTHTSGVLKTFNRKGLPSFMTSSKKRKKGEYSWLRTNKVYVSLWGDKKGKRFPMLTTLDHPGLVEVKAYQGTKRMKPREVVRYYTLLSNINFADKTINQYSSPRKASHRDKKVIINMLDVATWNAFYLYKRFVKPNEKLEYVDYRDSLISNLLNLEEGTLTELIVKNEMKNINRRSVNPPVTSPVSGHWPVRVPSKDGSTRNFSFFQCKVCQKRKIRRKTSYVCRGCSGNPPLCPSCFEEWHL